MYDSELRRQLFALIIGCPGCGKTTYAFLIANSILNQGKPVLWVIPDDEEKAFWDIEELCDTEDLEELAYQLRHFTSGMKKIFCEDIKIFDVIRSNFKNGLVGMDDARVYLKSRDEPFRKMIMRRRQMNCDMLFICHGLSEVPPSTNSFITDVILYQILDDIDSWTISNKKLYIPYVNRINQKAKTNPYYSERIKLRDVILN